MKKTFLDLLSESTIFQGFITLVVLLTWCWMMATGQQVPEMLTNIVFTVVGFFFGGKYVQAVQAARKE